MDIGAILRLLPTIMKAVDTVKSIGAAHKSGESVISIIQTKAPEVIDLVTKAGADLFPNLNQQQQVQAGAVRLDMAAVKKIQTQLNQVTGANLDVDGYYGQATKAAAKSFQVKAGLEPDGWVGPLTQAALDKATAGK